MASVGKISKEKVDSGTTKKERAVLMSPRQRVQLHNEQKKKTEEDHYTFQPKPHGEKKITLGKKNSCFDNLYKDAQKRGDERKRTPSSVTDDNISKPPTNKCSMETINRLYSSSGSGRSSSSTESIPNADEVEQKKGSTTTDDAKRFLDRQQYYVEKRNERLEAARALKNEKADQLSLKASTASPEGTGKFMDRQRQFVEKRNQKLEDARTLKSGKENDHLTFKPKVNQRRQSTGVAAHVAVHDRLYDLRQPPVAAALAQKESVKEVVPRRRPATGCAGAALAESLPKNGILRSGSADRSLSPAALVTAVAVDVSLSEVNCEKVAVVETALEQVKEQVESAVEVRVKIAMEQVESAVEVPVEITMEQVESATVEISQESIVDPVPEVEIVPVDEPIEEQPIDVGEEIPVEVPIELSVEQEEISVETVAVVIGKANVRGDVSGTGDTTSGDRIETKKERKARRKMEKLVAEGANA